MVETRAPGWPTETPGRRLPARAAGGRLSIIAALFLIGLVIPVFINIGPLRLSPYRLVLLFTLIPCLMLWLSGRAGQKIPGDWCIIVICCWSTFAMMVVHGVAYSIEPAGILILETAGPWFLARCMIRTPEAFYAMVRLLLILVLMLAPFGLYENLTGDNIALRFFAKLGPTWTDHAYPPRWGLDRVQGPFEHAILFGVFCGVNLGMVYYVLGYGKTMTGRLMRTAGVAVTAAMALSSGPLTALTSQSGLIVWDAAMRRQLVNHWKVLAVLVAVAYVTIDLLSNRTPFHVFASYFAFNASTAYSRIMIWDWGTRSIWNHPVFGIGFNDWERHPFMVGSVDMFWIVPAMRHGVVVWAAYLYMFFSTVVRVGKRKDLDDRLAAYRKGWIISMIGYFVVGWTVHFWAATFVLLHFLLAAGAWLADPRAADPAGAAGDRPAAPPKRRTLL